MIASELTPISRRKAQQKETKKPNKILKHKSEEGGHMKTKRGNAVGQTKKQKQPKLANMSAITD